MTCSKRIISMYDFPQNEKALEKRISSYRNALLKEQKQFGYVNDGAGKRYLLFSLYLVLNNLEQAQYYLSWYENEFSDDVGEPIQLLCWALILKRLGKNAEARKKLAETMLSNLYIIPKVLGKEIAAYDIWHSSSDADINYFDYMPREVIAALTEAEIQWIYQEYESLDFLRIRERYIEIYHQLQRLNNMEERKMLLAESHNLLDSLDQK